MPILKNNIVIPVDNQLNALLPIGTEEFPLQIFHDDLKNYHNGFVNWHKQNVIEISFVLEGSVKLCEFGEEYTLSAGDAFCVFPDKLHAVYSASPTPARYITLIFNPVLLYGYKGSYFEKAFCTYIDNGFSAILFKKSESFKKAENFFWKIVRCYPPQNRIQMLEIQQNLQKMWTAVYLHLPVPKKRAHKDPENIKIFNMIEYIHHSYSDKFSLDSMAGCIHVSKGECCRFFKKMMNMTIMEYLTEYRVSKSLYLLENTSLSITDIAQKTGFSTTSYFITVFKGKMSVTPLKYRRQFSAQ